MLTRPCRAHSGLSCFLYLYSWTTTSFCFSWQAIILLDLLPVSDCTYIYIFRSTFSPSVIFHVSLLRFTSPHNTSGPEPISFLSRLSTSIDFSPPLMMSLMKPPYPRHGGTCPAVYLQGTPVTCVRLFSMRSESKSLSVYIFFLNQPKRKRC